MGWNTIKLDARFVPPLFSHCAQNVLWGNIGKWALNVLFFLAVRYNTDRINYAYDTNFGRFRKTIADYHTICVEKLRNYNIFI